MYELLIVPIMSLLYWIRGRDWAGRTIIKEITLLIWSCLLVGWMWYFVDWSIYMTVISIAGIVFTYMTSVLGHGDGLDFGTIDRTDNSEWPNLILNRVPGLPRDGVLHDTLFMSINGISIVLYSAVLAFILLPWFVGVGILVSGLAKGLAYFGVFKAYNKPNLPASEALFGLFVGLGQLPVFMLV